MTFQEILERYNIPTAPEGNQHRREGWIQIDCPWCGKGSGKFHMGYSIGGRYLNCYRCRGHGLLATLVQATGEDREELRKLLGNLERDASAIAKDVRGKLTLPSPLDALSSEDATAHRRYLEGRRFDPEELVKLWGVQALGLGGRVKWGKDHRLNLAWRIFIPIQFNGLTVSWTTRTISPNPEIQRYISAPAECEAVNHKTLLLGEDLVRHAVCCVEGPFDAMNIGPGGVASCGQGFTRAQVEKLSRYPVRGVCFDNEPDAQQRARELVDMLSVFPGETYNIQLDSKDPGEATPKEIRSVREALGL